MPTECLPSTEFVLAREHTRALGLRTREYLQIFAEHCRASQKLQTESPVESKSGYDNVSLCIRPRWCSTELQEGCWFIYLFIICLSMTVTADLVIP